MCIVEYYVTLSLPNGRRHVAFVCVSCNLRLGPLQLLDRTGSVFPVFEHYEIQSQNRDKRICRECTYTYTYTCTYLKKSKNENQSLLLHFYSKFIAKIGLNAPGNYSGPFRSYNFLICSAADAMNFCGRCEELLASWPKTAK